ncbi:type IV pilus modification protein PilV [Thiolapillus sp.]
MTQPNRLQHGTTLVEVLIAAVIIGIGLLGIASLQVKALQASTNAEHRASATDLAAALADRIRANLGSRSDNNLVNYQTTPISACTGLNANNCAMAAGADDAAGVDQCSPADMAAFDLATIRCGEACLQDGICDKGGIKNILPGGELTISCAAVPCDGTTDMHIQVSWEVRNDTFGEGNSQGNAMDFITLTLIPGVDPEP